VQSGNWTSSFVRCCLNMGKLWLTVLLLFLRILWKLLLKLCSACGCLLCVVIKCSHTSEEHEKSLCPHFLHTFHWSAQKKGLSLEVLYPLYLEQYLFHILPSIAVISQTPSNHPI
jgi:hypothetical protein